MENVDNNKEIKKVAEVEEGAFTPAQKMDRLLRAGGSSGMKREIERLKAEAARNRVSAKEALEAKAQVEAKAEEIRNELNALKVAHRNEVIMRKLDAAGCLKSSLAVKDVPLECEDIDEFIEQYRAENSFLFSSKRSSHGGIFKPSKTKVLSPSQQMDRIIRAALGR